MGTARLALRIFRRARTMGAWRRIPARRSACARRRSAAAEPRRGARSDQASRSRRRMRARGMVGEEDTHHAASTSSQRTRRRRVVNDGVHRRSSPLLRPKPACLSRRTAPGTSLRDPAPRSFLILVHDGSRPVEALRGTRQYSGAFSTNSCGSASAGSRRRGPGQRRHTTKMRLQP